MSETESEIEAATIEGEESLSSEGEPRRAIPWRIAWELVKETVEGVDQLEVPLRAAAVAYYGLLAIFPLLLFLVSLGGVVLSRSEVRDALDEFLIRAIPVPEVLNFVQVTIGDTLARRGTVGVISLVVLLWSASSLFANLEMSLNKIWNVPRRLVWHRRLLGILAVTILAGLFIVVIFLSTLEALPLLNGISLFDSLDAWITFLAATLFFWLIYRWLPNHKVPAVPSLAGGALAGLAWLIAQAVFRWYLTSGLSNLGAVYGTLASLIGFILWAFVTGTILYVGAVFSAVLQRHFWE
ncbi:MAG: YihY/virulence factor BrkB family protein [Anaerolineales bacterium]